MSYFHKAAALIAWSLTSCVVQSSESSFATSALELDAFEDDDCVEVAHGDVMLQLLHDMCELLDAVLLEGVEWLEFDEWAATYAVPMSHMAGPILMQPYCEPFKISWMTAQCLLLLRAGDDGAGQALDCAAALDEDIYAQMTPTERGYNTRLHLVLRSPWPSFRLLDLLVRLHPAVASRQMGECRRFEKWNGEADAFDWPWFKHRLTLALDTVSRDSQLLQLQLQDGPLSRQYVARWHRVYGLPRMNDAMSFANDVSAAYKPRNADQAGCHLGVTSSFVMELLLHNIRDVDGHLHRLTRGVALLINILAPVGEAVHSDWPLFRLFHLASLLQRSPPESSWKDSSWKSEPRAPQEAAKMLCQSVAKAADVWVKDAANNHCSTPTVFVTAAWGALSRFARKVLAHWAEVFVARKGGRETCAPALVFLAADSEAMQQCSSVASSVHCVDAPRRLGVEPLIAKYLALASIAQKGLVAVWLDLDVYVAADPSHLFSAALAATGQPDILFARHQTSDSLSPAIVVAKGSPEAVDLLIKYARWLRENPFLLDHRGWDQFLGHNDGDHAGGFDYKGRTVKGDDGPNLSFVQKDGFAPYGARYGHVSSGIFGSGDGWEGPADGSDLFLFHFWGAAEPQSDLFGLFYPSTRRTSSSLPFFPPQAFRVVKQYRCQLSSAPMLHAMLAGGRPLHLVSVSYAGGCCEKSLKKNRRQALAVGVDDARAYGRRDLAPAWVTRNADTLSAKKGGGWWLWKPYLILHTLLDTSVPWGRGVVIYVDAGNFLHANPRPLVTSALEASDVAALRLKSCLEHDWTSRTTLHQLNVTERYSLVDQPQLGAYLLFFRKTALSIAFVREWLRLAEDAIALTGVDASRSTSSSGKTEDDFNLREPPSFQKHQADQSIFSILFKSYGFRSMSLEEGHSVVTLARWRE